MYAKKFEELVEIMKKLRKECPWDKTQTHDSIKAATIEEAYEVVEAIDEKDYEGLKGELGDLLLHIVFHSVIAEEEERFDIEAVIESINEKLIRRHPHVFGDTEIEGEEDVMRNWETIKLSEGRESILDGVPKNLSGIHRAYRLQEKASKVGFDWSSKEDVWKKVIEELEELKEIERGDNIALLEEEFGDLIFSMVNYSRFIGVNPENAIRRTNEKFLKRFQYIEKRLKEEGKEITKAGLKEMDLLWEESKKLN
jgi:XTP/dITP diphosphohydrolase